MKKKAAIKNSLGYYEVGEEQGVVYYRWARSEESSAEPILPHESTCYDGVAWGTPQELISHIEECVGSFRESEDEEEAEAGAEVVCFLVAALKTLF